MPNPFKPEDKVQTKVKGTTVDVVVRLVWNDEVQVRTPDNALVWRSASRVWFPGAAQHTHASKAANGGVEAAAVQAPVGAGCSDAAVSPPTPMQHASGGGAVTVVDESNTAQTAAETDAAAVQSGAADISTCQPNRPHASSNEQRETVPSGQNLTSCGIDDVRPSRRKTRKKNKK